MSTSNTSKHPSQRRYPPELRQRATLAKQAGMGRKGTSHAAVSARAAQGHYAGMTAALEFAGQVTYGHELLDTLKKSLGQG